MNDIIVIVVTHNRIELLKECIRQLELQTQSCDILIVNNASTDSTEKWCLSKINSKVHYVNTKKNIGGAGGFNYGMRWAVENGYGYIWLMDDDCSPYEDALEKIMEADKILEGKYGWLSSAVLWKDGHECNMNRQKLKKSFYDYLEYMQYGIVQAEQATFVSFFVKTSIVKQVGLPIKEFFIWGDDIEYTRRISVRENVPCFVVGKSKVIHAMTNNNGSSIATDNEQRIERYKYAFRNENYLYRQEGLFGIIYYIGKCGINILRILTKAKDKKMYRCYIVISSMLKGIFFNPKVEKV